MNDNDVFHTPIVTEGSSSVPQCEGGWACRASRMHQSGPNRGVLGSTGQEPGIAKTLTNSASLTAVRMPTVLMMALAYTSLMGGCTKPFELRLAVAHTKLGEEQGKVDERPIPCRHLG